MLKDDRLATFQLHTRTSNLSSTPTIAPNNGAQPPYNRIGPFDPRWKPNGGYPEPPGAKKAQCDYLKTSAQDIKSAGWFMTFTLNPAGPLTTGLGNLLSSYGNHTGCL
jgi:hypothetical protein